MPRVSTRSSAKATRAPPRAKRDPGRATRSARKAPGQDPSPSDSLPVPPAPSIDLQQGEGQGLKDRLARAEAAIAEAEARIARARADAAEAEARIALVRADAVEAEARIALVRADAVEDAARASAAMRNTNKPQPALNLDTLGHQPGHSAVNAETYGGQDFPAIVRTIARDLGVAVDAVNEVLSGKFEPLNLLRLHPTRGWSICEKESTIIMDFSGKIVFNKKLFDVKDYGDTSAPFIIGLVNYINVYCRLFGARRSDVVSAQLRFLSHILLQSETSDWESCIDYAMTRLTTILGNDIHDVAAWHT
ncbi:hypothetical protein E4U32_006829 [Claviceps aff. humidiphila group G2b]|nr:hypothetical protein E4U32_006829 [Claviceps aff. humidiphila group G2b]KAG6094743.1 hypothetical protein E4U31_006149 [Claviceps sp. LM219 group G6]